MKILIDTNIFLDVILDRVYAKESTMVLNACNQKLFDGIVVDITLLNIDYITSKQAKNLRDFLKIINDTFTVVGADNTIFDLAFNIDNNDLEDTIQYVCATVSECSMIISNDKNFYRGEVEVLTSEAFVSKYLSLKEK